MSEFCHSCKKDVMSNWDYCHYCDVALSEYAKSRERKVKCPNRNCTASNHVNANYCGTCGYALSEYAKIAQKNDRNRWRQKSEVLEQVLSESNSKNKEQENKFSDINKQLTDANIKIKKLESREVVHTIPTWIYLVFSIIGVVFLVLLFSFSKYNGH